VLVAPHERSEDSPEDQGHERPHHGGPPAPEMLSDTTGLLLGTPIPISVPFTSSGSVGSSRPGRVRGALPWGADHQGLGNELITRQSLSLAGPGYAVGTGWAGCSGTTIAQPEHERSFQTIRPRTDRHWVRCGSPLPRQPGLKTHARQGRLQRARPRWGSPWTSVG
jgi:hypothetical protein